MAFVKEPMTDETIALIEEAFKEAENNHINLLKNRSSTLDKERSAGLAIDREIGDFLILGSTIPQSQERYYYFYYKHKIYNLIISGDIWGGGILINIDNIKISNQNNLHYDFKIKLIEAFSTLNREHPHNKELRIGVQ